MFFSNQSKHFPPRDGKEMRFPELPQRYKINWKQKTINKQFRLRQIVYNNIRILDKK